MLTYNTDYILVKEENYNSVYYSPWRRLDIRLYNNNYGK
ncbi:hypothetical protein [Lacrimispora sp. 38-1]